MIELNKIYNEDCLKGLKKLADDSIDLICTDPPYVGVVKSEWDKTNPFTDELVKEFVRVLKNTGNIYVWCGVGEKSRSLFDFYEKLNKHLYFKDLITWKKQRGYGARRGWLYTREECLWFVKDNNEFTWNEANQYSDEIRKNPYGFNGTQTKSPYKRITNVWTDITEETFDTSKSTLSKKFHETPKPITSITRIINASTQKDDIVLDCFAGSGTTAIAAHRTGRNWIGFELDKNIFEQAQKRIKAETRQKRLF